MNYRQRELQINPTKKKLLDTANRMFAERSYEEVTVDEICKASGVTKGSFYHHFSSKYDLAMGQYRLTQEALYYDYESTAAMGPEWRLRYIILWYAGICNAENLHIFKNYYRVIINSPKSRTMRKISMEYKIIDEIIRQGQKIGVFSSEYESDYLAEITSRFIFSTLMDWVIFDGDLDLNQELSRLSKVTLQFLSVKNE